jgi:ribosome-binding protein aMBF1 (putative translation factor)
LKLDDVLQKIVPESIAVSDELDAIQLLREDDSIFDINASARRSLIDKDVSDRINKQASDSAENVGCHIRNKRMDIGVTQTELAERTGLDQALISKLEKGKHQPRFGTLSKYAKGLNLTVTDLLAQFYQLIVPVHCLLPK